MIPSLATDSSLRPTRLLCVVLKMPDPGCEVDAEVVHGREIWSSGWTPDGDRILVFDWSLEPAAVIGYHFEGSVGISLTQFWGVECSLVPKSFFKSWAPSVPPIAVIENPTRVIFAARPSASDVVDLVDAANFAQSHFAS